MAFGFGLPNLTSPNPEDDAALSPAMLAFLRGQQGAGTNFAQSGKPDHDGPTLPTSGGFGRLAAPLGFASPPTAGTDDGKTVGKGFGDLPAVAMGGASGNGGPATPNAVAMPAAFGFGSPSSLRRSVIDPQTGNAQLSADALAAAPDPNEIVERGLLLPLGRTRGGQTVLASQGPVHAIGKAIEGLPDAPQQAADAIGFFGDVVAGRKGVFDPATGHVSDEAMGAAGTAAGLAMTGSMPFGVPSGALRTFGGRAAATADHSALDRAAGMQAAGARPESIWQGTGWGLGRDGVLRFEIPDDAARLRPHDGSPTNSLGSLLDHPALFDAYPQLRDVSVFHRPELGPNAAADPARNRIALNLSDPQALDSLLHETQHLVQRTEGFAPGASPIDPALAAHPQVAQAAALRQRLDGLDAPAQALALADRTDQAARMSAYRTAAGEVEARNVETRRAMTPDERSATPPWATQDVPSDRQWIPRGRGDAVTGDAAQLKVGEAAHADPIAALQAALGDLPPAALPPGPRRLDPTAASWALYHGSTPGPDFPRFDPTKGTNPAEQAVFFAPNPETASGYAGSTKAGAEAGSRVYRTTVEPGRTGVFDLTHLAETDPAFNARAREITIKNEGGAYGPVHDDYMSDFRARRAQEQDIARQAAEMGYTTTPDHTANVSFGYGHIGAAIERAKAQGLDTAILRGLAEHGGDDQVVALTPNRVRSAYAPDQLLYGAAGLGAGTAAFGFGVPGDAQAAPGQQGQGRSALADRIVGAESSGNATAKNPNSSATGAGQFIAGTWLDMMRRHRPDLAGSLPKEQLLALRNDPALSREMVAHYADENGAKLRAAGLPDNDGTRYLSHFAGSKGAKSILSADPGTPAAQVLDAAQVAANPFVRKMTAGQLADWAAQKVSGSAPKMTMPGGSNRPAAFGLAGPTQAPEIGFVLPAGGAGAAAPAGDAMATSPASGTADALKSLGGMSGGSGQGGQKRGPADAPMQFHPVRPRPFGFMAPMRFAGQQTHHQRTKR